MLNTKLINLYNNVFILANYLIILRFIPLATSSAICFAFIVSILFTLTAFH